MEILKLNNQQMICGVSNVITNSVFNFLGEKPGFW